MSSIAKKFFSASLIYLLLGLLAQAVTIFDLWLGFNPLAYTAVAAAEQLLLIGWLTQLALALIYDGRLSFLDLPPKPGSKTAPASFSLSSASSPLSSASSLLCSPLAAFVLFNLGLPLVVVAQPGFALFGGRWLGPVAAFGGLLQLFAGLLLVHNIWRRLKRS